MDNGKSKNAENTSSDSMPNRYYNGYKVAYTPSKLIDATQKIMQERATTSDKEVPTTRDK